MEDVRLLTCKGRHAFLLRIDIDEHVLVQAGFTSGYPGEGPRTLAEALHLLEVLHILVEEVEVLPDLFQRLEASALTWNDLEWIRSAPPIRPWRLSDYIYEWRHIVPMSSTDVAVLQGLPLTMPWPLVDARMSDFAFAFLDRPDETLLKGFRRLEEVIRVRTALDEHGTRLFQKAFAGESSILMWPGIDQGEHTGRAQLFVGAFMAFRNPLAHREKTREPAVLLHQFIQLNYLFLLEAQACRRPHESEPSNRGQP